MLYFNKNNLTATAFWERKPNLPEIFKKNVPYALCITAFGAKLAGFTHYSSLRFVRDLTKVGAVGFAYATGTERGSTGIKYDGGHVIAAAVHASCKLLVIGGVAFSGFVSSDSAAKVSNAVCGIPAGFVVVTSREYQAYKKSTEQPHLSYHEFMVNNSYDILVDTVKSSLTGTITTDYAMDPLITPTKKFIEGLTGQTAQNLMIMMCFKATGQEQSFGEGGFENAGVYNNIIKCGAVGAVSRALVPIGFFTVDMASRFICETLLCIIIVPISHTVIESSVPDQFFGSLPKVISTISGISIAAMCFIEGVPPIICSSSGIAIKVEMDNMFSEIAEYWTGTQSPAVVGKESFLQQENSQMEL